MSAFRNITGLRFGRLIALEPRGSNDSERKLWLCRCDCGGTKVASSKHLIRGSTRSCGCLRQDAHRTHGRSDTSTYDIWAGMRRRCRNPKHKRFKDYGGRGIEDRYPSFEAFRANMGERPPGCDLHRKDNDGHYEPGNCVWLSRSEHMKLHRRRVTRSDSSCGP